MGITRYGVAHDLTISPYSLVVDYQDESLEYVFSSEQYKNIFYKKFIDNRIKINESLSNRFGFKIEVDKLADLKLYSMTEKRGFLIKGKDDFKCLNTIELIGVNLMNKN